MEKTNKKGFLAWLTDNWKRKPLFSTGIALLVMVILQILALGFDYASFGEWFAAFSRNWINILRNNAGVGIIALGMTFVIISGGIDLAVGSTLVAVGAIAMCLMDGGPAGLLAGLGITGIPAYIIAIAIGILLGVLLGECTGVLVAHFGMPPFIATLGMMKICRSVTQQCMQKASPTVPKAFLKIANARIGGEIILPILYWLALAGILHVGSKHTAFGRQERTHQQTQRRERARGQAPRLRADGRAGRGDGGHSDCPYRQHGLRQRGQRIRNGRDCGGHHRRHEHERRHGYDLRNRDRLAVHGRSGKHAEHSWR